MPTGTTRAVLLNHRSALMLNRRSAVLLNRRSAVLLNHRSAVLLNRQSAPCCSTTGARRVTRRKREAGSGGDSPSRTARAGG